MSNPPATCQGDSAREGLPCDLLIIGAGPVGLVAACEAVRHGLRCRIIDANEHPSLYSKAQVVHTRTLEILEDLGTIAPFLEQGRLLRGVSLFTPELKRITHLPFSLESAETHYSSSLSIAQEKTEELLRAHLLLLGVAVERPLRLDSFTQDAEGVTAMLRHPGEHTEEVRCSWLLGCDGVDSTVRQLLQLPFEGVAPTHEQRILQADVRIDWDFQHSDEEVLGFLGPSGPLGVFPLPGEKRYRLLTFARPDEPLTPQLETFVELMRARGPRGAKVSDPVWMVDFRFHRRIVPRYRVGRVFLAGDAAHIHSPAGCQGLNSGIQDSYNLLWKLALVERGHAHAALLDSYHSERHPVAAATLRSTDLLARRFTTLLNLQQPIGSELKTQLAGFVAGLEMVQHRASRAVSMLEVAYPASPIVAEDRSSPLSATLGLDAHSESPSFTDWLDFGHGPAPGERASDAVLPDAQGKAQRLFELLRGTRHNLLLFDGAVATPEGYRRLLDIETRVRAQYGPHIAVHIIVPYESAPQGLLQALEQAQAAEKPSILFDAEGELHRRYGARSECLFLLRPDKYIAYRCQPADGDKLFTYLNRIFIAERSGGDGLASG